MKQLSQSNVSEIESQLEPETNEIKIIKDDI